MNSAIFRCPQCPWQLTIHREARDAAELAYNQHETETGHLSGIPFSILASVIADMKDSSAPESSP